MKKELFNELVASIKEAGRIHRGEIPPSREFTFDHRSRILSQALLHKKCD